jgi:hypothetical protein
MLEGGSDGLEDDGAGNWRATEGNMERISG